MPKRLSLLQRYEIDVEKLDFLYIESCENANELEKIYKILVSNEEGFYPDLTEAAKRRLSVVNPFSKCIRSEEKVINREYSDPELQEEFAIGLGQFLKGIQNKSNSSTKCELELPCIPIRSDSSMIEIVPINQKERSLENKAHIEEIKTEKLTEGQLKELEKSHRNRGNNFYRAKEYQEALEEYGKCIEILPTASSFNNRGITYMKLKRYDEAIEDLNSCLALESHNAKALLRKADIFMKLHKKREALDVYGTIAEQTSPSEGNCSEFVKEQIEKLQRELKVEDTPAASCPPDFLVEGFKKEVAETDFAKLIIPKKIVCSNSKKLVETFKGMNKKKLMNLEKIKEPSSTKTRSLLIQEM